MLTLTELAMDDLPEQHEARDNLEKVLSAGGRAKILVQQISDYCRDKEPPQGPVELQPLVEETLGLLRTTLPATVEIRKDFDASGAKVCADPSQIHQILMNLSKNAADALDGKVGILEFRLEKCVVKTSSEEHREHVKLVIQDNGSGMDEETVERIFDPFYTTKEVGSGTGMGLAIVYSIIAGFGGMIEVKSEPGQGTAFEILIPLWTDDDEINVGGAKPDEAGPRGNAETLTVRG
jgi:signal transduction histidine kinase